MNYTYNTIKILILIIPFLISKISIAQCLSNVDFNTWNQEGNPLYGNWVVNSSGSSLQQTINSAQTFFISPFDLINVEINGKIKVNTNDDDDFIGFVMGYRGPFGIPNDVYDCWLFDWKQSYQKKSSYKAYEGFNLSYINGQIASNQTNDRKYFFGHTNDPPLFNAVASNLGTNLGWKNYTDHIFKLIYTSTKITILIDGDTIFDLTGCYQPGRFGFYNYSQEDVIYSDFNYKLRVDYDIVSSKVCHEDTAEFIFIDTSCYMGKLGFDSIKWDFGDGYFINDIASFEDSILKPKHFYSSPGQYDVKLIVVDSIGCTDTVIKQIVIAPDPGLAGGDSTLCSNSAGFDLFDVLNGTPDKGGAWYEQSNLVSSILDPSISQGGIYTYVVSGLNGACSDSSQNVNVIVNTLPFAGLDNDTSMCEDHISFDLFSSLLGTPDLGGYWEDQTGTVVSNIFDPSLQTNTDFKYIINGTSPCPNDTSYVKVNVYNIPNPGTSGTITICNNDTPFDMFLKIGGIPDAGGIWTDNLANNVSNIFDPSTQNAGIFKYNLSGGGYCPDTNSTVEVFINTFANAGNDTSVNICILDNPVDLFTKIPGQPALGGVWKDDIGNTSSNSFDPSMQNSGSFYYITSNTLPCPNDSANVSVNVISSPDPGLPGYVEVCYGEEVFDLFDHLGGSPQNVGNWTNSNGDIVSSDFDPLLNSSEIFTYTVSGLAPCPSASSDVEVVVNNLPVIDITATETNLYISQSTQINSSGGTQYIWNSSQYLSCEFCDNPIITPRESQFYYLSVTDENGCENTDSIYIEVIIPNDKVFIPNAFSPNNDGENDRFYVRGLDIREMEMQIFNRYGKMIYQSNDIDDGWDGTLYGQELTKDVFIYVVKVTFNDDKIEHYKGNVSLVK